MPSYRSLLSMIGAAAIAMGSVFAGHAKAQPAPTLVQSTMTTSAVVESVDMKTRQVLLSGPSGKMVTVVAGPAVHNLDQVRAGDNVVLTYTKAVAVQLSSAGGKLPAPAGVVGMARAAKGQLPAGAAYEAVDVHVRIDSVDQKTGLVNFTRADGSQGSVTVVNPAMLNFARQLKPGDNVEVNYLQGVTIRDVRLTP